MSYDNLKSYDDSDLIIPVCKNTHAQGCNSCWYYLGENSLPESQSKIPWKKLYMRLEINRHLLSEKFRKQSQTQEALALGDYQAYLITLSLDKSCNHIDQMKVIKEIQKTGYKSIISPNSKYSLEYYGSTDLSWNPHIHIYSDKLKSFSSTAQPLQRKFIKDKYKVYRVNVVSRPSIAISDYIIGEKSQKKSDAIHLDQKYRLEHKIPDYSQLF